MTREDYELIAQAINESRPQEGKGTITYSVWDSTCTMVANRLAARFAHNNPRFDTYRFLEACGVNVSRQ